MLEKNTYKYVVKRNGKIVLRGRTYDLERREAEHMSDYPDCIVEQVGNKTTWQEAERWLNEEQMAGTTVFRVKHVLLEEIISWLPECKDYQEWKKRIILEHNKYHKLDTLPHGKDALETFLEGVAK